MHLVLDALKVSKSRAIGRHYSILMAVWELVIGFLWRTQVGKQSISIAGKQPLAVAGKQPIAVALLTI